MSHSPHDLPPDDLREVAAALRENRPQLDPLELDSIKLRAMRGNTPTTARRRLFTTLATRSRLTAFLTTGFVLVGSGGAYAIAGGGGSFGFGDFGFGKDDGGSAGFHQYHPPCQPGHGYGDDKHCHVFPPPPPPPHEKDKGGDKGHGHD
jgi:hypothetical protein